GRRWSSGRIGISTSEPVAVDASKMANPVGHARAPHSVSAASRDGDRNPITVNNTDDFTFQGQGTLKRIDTFVSKAGKPILTLIFETGGQYPQMIPIKV